MLLFIYMFERRFSKTVCQNLLNFGVEFFIFFWIIIKSDFSDSFQEYNILWNKNIVK